MRICNLCGDSDTTYTHNTNAKLSQLLVKTTNGTVTKYVYGRGLIGEETAGVFKTYHFDFRGSTVALTDSNGNITDAFSYDTYGKLIEQTGTSEIIFGYNGRDGVITDTNGIIYMRARYYSPELRRFINADIIAGEITNAITLNRYAYANGNPVSNTDPFGLRVTSQFHMVCVMDGGGTASTQTTSSNNSNNHSSQSNSNDDATNQLESSYTPPITFNGSSSYGSNKRPYRGDPGSTYEAPNGDTRTYGPDGTPKHDYDHDDHGNPKQHPHDENGGHNHDWNDGKRGPAYSINWGAVAGVALITVCVVGLTVVIIDDATGLGAADDFLIGPLSTGVGKGLILILG